jgi:hypothetical protein
LQIRKKVTGEVLFTLNVDFEETAIRLKTEKAPNGPDA